MAFDLAACLRVALQSIFPGDEVDFQESEWTVKAGFQGSENTTPIVPS